jgi:hypothetical protein
MLVGGVLRVEAAVSAALIVWASVACSSTEHPPALPDNTTHTTGTAGAAGAGGSSTGAGGDVVGQSDSGRADGASSDGGEGMPGNGGDFTQCWNTVMALRSNVTDPWFCASTTKGHPADAATYRNLLYPIVSFAPVLDAKDRMLQVTMTYDWAWTFMIRVPDGQMLAPGTYTTDPATDTAIGLTWDHDGSCGGVPESGSFTIYKIEWDATNALKTAEIDFTHRCGDSTPCYARFRFNSSRPP